VESESALKRLVGRFSEVIQLKTNPPLDEAWALIGSALAPEGAVDVASQLLRLDQMANEVPETTVEGLIEYLFHGARPLTGNVTDYYSPSNSLLHRMLDQRTGIPISLSIVLIEVGRRLGIAMNGVGMPAHFLVGLTPSKGLIPEIFIDPFHGGQVMDREQARLLFQRVAGTHQHFDLRFLAITPTLGILERVLNNLKAIYIRNGDVGSLRTVMMFRARLPGIGPTETDEFRRLVAPLN
jgi:regulator of sirC expression with transglutaminase-like and TPR domain